MKISNREALAMQAADSYRATGNREAFDSVLATLGYRVHSLSPRALGGIVLWDSIKSIFARV